MKERFIFLKALAIIAAAVLSGMGLHRWTGEPEGIAGILGSVIPISIFIALLFYFFVIRPYRELAEQRVSLMNNLPGVAYRGHRDWSVSFIGAHVEQVTGHTAKDLLDGVVGTFLRIRRSLPPGGSSAGGAKRSCWRRTMNPYGISQSGYWSPTGTGFLSHATVRRRLRFPVGTARRSRWPFSTWSCRRRGGRRRTKR